ncbi:MAG TPA: hypothetical protein VF534_13265 [Paraburkholderia sp.]
MSTTCTLRHYDKRCSLTSAKRQAKPLLSSTITLLLREAFDTAVA